MATLKSAYMHNPHGCGFATGKGCYKSIYFGKFAKEIEKVGRDEACIIHFRRATHGSIKTENCHPFADNGVYFAHNGILGVTPTNDMTDSEYAFRKYFVPIIRRYGIDSPELAIAVKKIIGWSKFAFLQGDKIKKFGHFVEIAGCYYSNTNFCFT